MKSWFQGSPNRQVFPANETFTWCSIHETRTQSRLPLLKTRPFPTRSHHAHPARGHTKLHLPLISEHCSILDVHSSVLATCASSRLCARLAPPKTQKPHWIGESAGPRYWRAAGDSSQILPRLHSPSFRIQPSGVRLWARNRHPPGDGKSQPLAHASFQGTDPPKPQKVIAGRDVYALYGHLSAKSVQFTYKGKVGCLSACF